MIDSVFFFRRNAKQKRLNKPCKYCADAHAAKVKSNSAGESSL